MMCKPWGPTWNVSKRTSPQWTLGKTITWGPEHPGLASFGLAGCQCAEYTTKQDVITSNCHEQTGNYLCHRPLCAHYQRDHPHNAGRSWPWEASRQLRGEYYFARPHATCSNPTNAGPKGTNSKCEPRASLQNMKRLTTDTCARSHNKNMH